MKGKPVNSRNVRDMDPLESMRNSIYQIGGTAALLTVAAVLIELVVTFLPGGNVPVETVADWFTQLQANWFMGLRNLGLMNILMFAMGIPMYFALYTAHSKKMKEFAALAMIISFVGTALFFATNRAFPMLELSREYAQTTTDTQRTILLSAGRAMLSVGRSHSPGTFLGFFLGEVGGVLMSAVMLRGRIFRRTTALLGIAGFALLSVFEVCTSFVPALSGVAMIFAMGGAVLNIAWLVLVGHRFFRLVGTDMR